MKKTLLALLFGLSTLIASAQVVTNTVTFTNVATVVSTYGVNFVNVVSSLGPAYTNQPSWITNYVNAVVYTNGITRSNSVVYCWWGEPPNQEKGVYQGPYRPWGGKFTITLDRAAVRVKPGEKIYTTIIGNSGIQMVGTNMVLSTNWGMPLVIDIPTNKPAWLP